jgi:hypothetical protein
MLAMTCTFEVPVLVTVNAWTPEAVPTGTPPKPIPVGLSRRLLRTYVNLSPLLMALVPPAVVTLTSTVLLAAPAGLVAVIWVALLTVKVVAAVAPKATAVAPVRFVPVIVTDVPPAGGPPLGTRELTVGAAVMYVNLSPALMALVPPAVVTVTSTVLLAAPAGLVAVIWVALLTAKVVAAVAPKATAVAPVRLVPVIVTEVPPAGGPPLGTRELTVGAAVRYVNLSPALMALVTPATVTRTSTVPEPAGLVAVTEVVLLTMTPVAAVVPNVTAVAPPRLVPVIVTEVPPPPGPELGATELTVGGEAPDSV